MRTLEPTFVTKPSVTVAPACPPPLWDTSVPNAAGHVVRTVLSRPAAAAALSSAAVTARPKSRVEGTGVGYATPADARRGADASGRDVPGGNAAGARFIGTNGTNGKQQGQLHLMSRRDPRTWRPPAD